MPHPYMYDPAQRRLYTKLLCIILRSYSNERVMGPTWTQLTNEDISSQHTGQCVGEWWSGAGGCEYGTPLDLRQATRLCFTTMSRSHQSLSEFHTNRWNSFEGYFRILLCLVQEICVFIWRSTKAHCLWKCANKKWIGNVLKRNVHEMCLASEISPMLAGNLGAATVKGSADSQLP